jgi:hypothetical protein
VHRPSFARPKRRTRLSRRHRSRSALENWLAWHGSSRRWSRNIRIRCGRGRQRRLINRTRAGLRHDHSRRRCNWSRRPHRCCVLYRRDTSWSSRSASLRRWNACNRRCWRRKARRNSDRRRCSIGLSRRRSWSRSSGRGLWRNHNHRRGAIRGCNRSGSHHPWCWSRRLRSLNRPWRCSFRYR